MGGDVVLLVFIGLVVAGLLFAANRALSQNGKSRGG
jgi:hypothetical protein